jgi:hypothetical protein
MNCEEFSNCFNASYKAIIFVIIVVTCAAIWVVSIWWPGVPHVKFAISTLLAVMAKVMDEYAKPEGAANE